MSNPFFDHPILNCPYKRPSRHWELDADGNVETRGDAISVFNGPRPAIAIFSSQSDESEALAVWIAERIALNVVPNEIAVFVRSSAQLHRAKVAAELAGVACRVLDEWSVKTTSQITISTMHLAKGLEFRAVAVMACDDEVIPLQERIETATGEDDLREVYETERHLLYVACTRARDYLLITAVEPASEFLDDLNTDLFQT
jgi:superfamily I DNA/RNA helicase